jgi:hypothetical protein
MDIRFRMSIIPTIAEGSIQKLVFRTHSALLRAGFDAESMRNSHLGARRIPEGLRRLRFSTIPARPG